MTAYGPQNRLAQLQDGPFSICLELHHFGMGLVDAARTFGHELFVARMPFEAPEPGQLRKEEVDERVLLEQAPVSVATASSFMNPMGVNCVVHR